MTWQQENERKLRGIEEHIRFYEKMRDEETDAEERAWIDEYRLAELYRQRDLFTQQNLDYDRQLEVGIKQPRKKWFWQ